MPQPAVPVRAVTTAPSLSSPPLLAADRPQAAPSGLAEIWARVLEAAGGGRASGWLTSLELVSITERFARLTPCPGKRDILNFARHARATDQLSQWFSAALARRVRVEVVPRADESAAASDAPGTLSGTGPVGLPQQRQQALALPLVQQVLEHFDATLLGVRPESRSSPAQAAVAPGENAEDEPLPTSESADV